MPKRGKTQQNQEKGTSQTPQDKWFREPARITLPTLSSAIEKYKQPNPILFFLWGGVLGGFCFERFLRRFSNKNRKNRRHGNFQGNLSAKIGKPSYITKNSKAGNPIHDTERFFQGSSLIPFRTSLGRQGSAFLIFATSVWRLFRLKRRVVARRNKRQNENKTRDKTRDKTRTHRSV